tara:strand:- start:260 stop:1150 length:891 start_codon:yes stop_codon:yes gene_type:complete
MPGPDEFYRALSRALGHGRFSNPSVTKEIFDPKTYAKKDGKLIYRSSGEEVKMRDKKPKLKVRGVDVDKLPEGRIKEEDPPFPFMKRFEHGGRSVDYVSNYIPDPLATGDVTTTTTSGTYTSDSKLFDGRDGDVSDPDDDLGNIQNAVIEKFGRDRTGRSDTGYYDAATDKSYRGLATGEEGGAYPNRLKTSMKQGYDPNYSPNMGIKNMQIKRSSNPFEALIQLKTKNILNPNPVQPKMVDPLYKIYGRKLNQQTGEYVYNTNKGEVRKQRGPEDAQFISQNRKAFDEMRKKYRR